MDEKDKSVVVIDKSNSVELKISAKGDVTFNVKCYAATTKEAAEEAKKVFEELRKEYDMD